MTAPEPTKITVSCFLNVTCVHSNAPSEEHAPVCLGAAERRTAEHER